ncbi:MAG TPA: hypothetical protein PLV44_05530, partial [Myxococcota bacterium]|nr:hypothetical protein [Myxococcota bacterium]
SAANYPEPPAYANASGGDSLINNQNCVPETNLAPRPLNWAGIDPKITAIIVSRPSIQAHLRRCLRQFETRCTVKYTFTQIGKGALHMNLSRQPSSSTRR